MDPTDRTQLISDLQGKIDEAILPYVQKLDELVLLDFPNYANVGDSAIYKGELEFFRKHFRLTPAIVSDCDFIPWQEIENTNKNTPIFLNGGGNFGDLWPRHQDFRESILAKFPERLVVQLPQSIHYNNKQAISRTAHAIKNHKNFVLFVRDEASFLLATENFHCEIKKCPDMAFHMGALNSPSVPTNDLLLLLRTDHEKGDVKPEAVDKLPAKTIVTDWVEDDISMKRNARARTLLGALLSPKFTKMSMKNSYYNALTNARLRRGLNLLSSSKFVITDRLHVHILSILLNIPHVVLDNNYGKVSRFVKMWTENAPRMTRADSVSVALEIYREKYPSWEKYPR